ncbi:MAG: family 78 glycoside hydrolase catalytic domain [Ancrocorticia sp.]|nr:family 78 glycoside hydrolase catalytic domain [Ancrocorticia sp.]
MTTESDMSLTEDLAPHSWHANFITAPFACGAATDPALYVRRTFSVEPGLKRATLYASALGLIDPHINGNRIGDEVLLPGWTSYKYRTLVSQFDVTAQLAVGSNAIGAIVGQGWAVGRIGWEGKSHLWSDKPAAFLELRLDYGDHETVISSDESFHVGTGALRENGIYDGETYDATARCPGWDLPEFDDSSWVYATVVPWDMAAVQLRSCAPIRRIEELAPVAITQRSGAAIVDFGQNISGWVRIGVHNAPAGTRIQLRHAELLNADGTVNTSNLRSAKATDTWIPGGQEHEEYEPRFTRYVEVAGYRALRNQGCRWGLKPPASSRLREM